MLPGTTGWSRCDLVLGSHSSLEVVAKVFVATGVMDGGHSPVLIELRGQSLALPWFAPRPRLPTLLRLPPPDLGTSKEWKALLEEWQLTPDYRRLLSMSASSSAEDLSSTLSQALEALVTCAGGRVISSSAHRPAYASLATRQLRNTIL